MAPSVVAIGIAILPVSVIPSLVAKSSQNQPAIAPAIAPILAPIGPPNAAPRAAPRMLPNPAPINFSLSLPKASLMLSTRLFVRSDAYSLKSGTSGI